MPVLRPFIARWCLQYPPEGNVVPQQYKDHSLNLIIAVRAACLVGLFFTGSYLWAWLICWPIILAFNTEDFEKVYEEYWEIRIKRKPTLTEALTRITTLWVEKKLDALEKRHGKK